MIFFLVYQFKAFNAVIVEENVVIVCFLNAMRKKKLSLGDISSNEQILTKV